MEGKGKTKILGDVVIHPKSQRYRFQKFGSVLWQKKKRKKAHLETLTWWDPQDKGRKCWKMAFKKLIHMK